MFPQGFEQYQDAYSIVLFVINFALPLSTMVILYSLVDKKIREHILVKKRLRDEQNRAMSTVTQNSVCTEEPQSALRGSLVSPTACKNQEEIELEYTPISSNKDEERQ